MKEDFKKWLCGLTGLAYTSNLFLGNSMTELLVDAMWAINRECMELEDGEITMYRGTITVRIPRKGIYQEKDFSFEDHNNSEQEALTAAIEYIFEQDKK